MLPSHTVNVFLWSQLVELADRLESHGIVRSPIECKWKLYQCVARGPYSSKLSSLRNEYVNNRLNVHEDDEPVFVDALSTNFQNTCCDRNGSLSPSLLYLSRRPASLGELGLWFGSYRR